MQTYYQPKEIWENVAQFWGRPSAVGVNKLFSKQLETKCRSPAIERKRRVPGQPFICPKHLLLQPLYSLQSDIPCCLPDTLQTPEDWTILYKLIKAASESENIAVIIKDEKENGEITILKDFSIPTLANGYEWSDNIYSLAVIRLDDYRGLVFYSKDTNSIDKNILKLIVADKPTEEENFASDLPTDQRMRAWWNSNVSASLENQDKFFNHAKIYNRPELISNYQQMQRDETENDMDEDDMDDRADF